MDANRTLRYIESNEGRRTKVYRDTKGIPTIGVGFNLTRGDARAKIAALGVDYDALLRGDVELTNDQIDSLFFDDVKACAAIARRLFPHFESLNEDRQICLTDMAMMGEGTFSGFHTFIPLMDSGQFEAAATDLEQHTLWYKQTGHRGIKAAACIRTGVLQEGNPAPVSSAPAPAPKPDLKALADAARTAVNALCAAVEAG